MAQPTPYSRGYSFSNFQTANPTAPLPGNKVDIEYNNIRITLAEILANLALIQRDDGRLANGSVGVSQMDGALISLGFERPTNWATATAYPVDSAVFQSNKLFICLVAHTSTTFNTDLANGKWTETIDFTTLVVDAAAEADAAAVSAAAALASQIDAAASKATVDATAAIIASNADSWYGDASGTNSYTLSAIPDWTPGSPTNGTEVDFRVVNANTGACTLTLGAWASKDVKRYDGSALVSGDWPAGAIVKCIYSSASGDFHWIGGIGNASESAPGAVELATTAEATAGIDTARAVTAAGLSAAVTATLAALAPINEVAIQVFTASGTYNKPSDLAYALVITTGGGGGAGGADSDGSGGGGTGGGGAGETKIHILTASSVGITETVTIGTGGTAGAATGTPGGAGGDSSFGAHHTATGGSGSAGRNFNNAQDIGPGAAGGTGGAGGTITLQGGAGSHGFGVSSVTMGGTGGASFWGGGGRGSSGNVTGAGPGSAGAAPGTGAGGAVNADTTAGTVGSVGADGLCVVIEFKK